MVKLSLALTAALALLTVATTPTFASDQLAQKAGVSPGSYTSNEMLQIISEPTSLKRKSRIELIEKQRDAFASAVVAATTGSQSTKSFDR